MITVVVAVLALVRDFTDLKIGTISDADASATSTPGRSEQYGWGPGRDMYRVKETSPTAVFNSIIDNPYIGDERNFVKCRIEGVSNAKYADEIAIRADVYISVWVAIDNSSTRPDQAIRGGRMVMTSSPSKTPNPAVNVLLMGDNAAKVWDGCKVLSANPVTLYYVPGSATLDIADLEPFAIDDAVVRGGALLPGIRGNAAGVVGGDKTRYGYVTFRMRALLED
ncbi:hypothetical protein [Nocardia sp. NPDC060249]|uniref:hypothetical protein n=1 Tax=Nocardia sp. NPDC060249 TaxID=3347082 RepID=UPI00364D13DE